MVAETAIIAIIVAALAVYGIALSGDHPFFSKYLRGLDGNQPHSRALRILPFGIALGAALYAFFFSNGEFGAPIGTVRWWVGVTVTIVAVVLVGASLLRSATS